MKLGNLLSRPKWQDKDPAVRRAAIAGVADPGLQAALPRIAREDPDAGARIAALRRADDAPLWRERAFADPDEGLRKQALRACVTHLDALPADADLSPWQAVFDALDAHQLERVATGANAAAVRGVALQRVQRAGFVAERAIQDADAQLRLTAVQRINDSGLLERIAERTRKTDKHVHRVARERLEAQRLDAGDATALAARALQLCSRLESLLRDPGTDLGAALAALDADWSALGENVPDTLRRRFRGARGTAQQALALLADDQALARVVHAHRETAISAAEPAQLDAAPTQAQLDAAAAARAEKRERQQLRAELKHVLDALEVALDAGQVPTASKLQMQAMTRVEAEQDQVTQALRLRLDGLVARLSKLREWQRWSNRKRRNEMCRQLDALLRDAAHPDALAGRVRALREEWQALDSAEGIDANAPADGLATRFNGLCQRALRNIRPYFAAREQLRHARTEATNDILARIAALADDCSDWQALHALRIEARAALHALDGTDARQRNALAQGLKAGIARITALCKAHEDDVAHRKARLIEQAEALGSAAALPSNARAVRELQRQWQTLGSGKRSADNTQWRAFKSSCDAVFVGLDRQREQTAQAQALQREAVEALLARFASLQQASRTGADDSLSMQLRELEREWSALGDTDEGSRRRQQQARKAIADSIASAARRARLRDLEHALQLHAAWLGGAARPEVAHEADAGATASLHETLLARVLPDDHTSQAQAESARELLVRLELLAGLASPPEDQALRMRVQVARLSLQVRGARSAPAAEQSLRELLIAWFHLPGQCVALEQRFASSASAALLALP